MIEIGDIKIKKARPERVTPRPLQKRLSWRAPAKLINQRITVLINASSLDRYLLDQKRGTSIVPAERRGIECCASAYPEL